MKWLVAAFFLVVAGFVPSTASAQDQSVPSASHEATATATSGGMGAGASESIPPAQQVSDARSVVNEANGPESTLERQQLLVPTCMGNTATTRADVLCTAAAMACPNADEVRMWVYSRTVDTATGPATWPPFVMTDVRCVGPREQVVDPAVVIAGMIRREFESRAVLRGVAETSPAPRTLVNVATRLRTPTVERYPIEFSLLGQRVVIQVQAVRWTWVTGDGARRSTSAAGTMGQVEYVYRRAGVHRPYVEIAWRGTWSLNGRDMGAVPGTVTTRGEPVTVEVSEARTQLVDG